MSVASTCAPRRVWLVPLAMTVALLAPSGSASAQSDAASPRGDDVYRRACAACHGDDGRGVPRAGQALGIPLPDFTDCSFGTREPNEDWAAVSHDGGPARGFDPLMPAFGDALSAAEIEAALNHMREFCEDRAWPRGELNLPRPLITEKAFPEDEVVVSTAVDTEGEGGVTNKVIYERRFGARNQVEFVVPIAAHDRGDAGGWTGGIGDFAVGVKRALFHNHESGTIFSATGEMIFPTGNDTRGLGKGVAVFEPFVTFGQFLPGASFVQVQTGVELPFDTDRAAQEAFWRVTVGRSFSQARWGRTWSPMVEVLGARELVSGEAVQWDVVPQVQVTLSTRQHIMLNAGVRVPVNDAGPRRTQVLMYLLWDWFDGGFFDGW